MLLQLRPRSGLEYTFSGDAPASVHYLLYIILFGSLGLSFYWLMPRFVWSGDDLITELKEFAFVVGVAGIICSPFVIGTAWLFSLWLRSNTLTLQRDGLRGRFPELEVTIPFHEVEQIWLCNHPDCRSAPTCLARFPGATFPGEEAAAALRWIEAFFAWNLGLVAGTLALLAAFLGGGGAQRPEPRPAVKLFLALRGGVVYSLERYLQRFRLEDRTRLIELLRQHGPDQFGCHDPT